MPNSDRFWVNLRRQAEHPGFTGRIILDVKDGTAQNVETNIRRKAQTVENGEVVELTETGGGHATGNL